MNEMHDDEVGVSNAPARNEQKCSSWRLRR